jgi:hyperosmotically inducible protein
MNSKSTGKIVIGGGMAVIVVIGAVSFALLSHRRASVAQIMQPPAAVAPVPDAPVAAAPIPDVPAAAATIPDAPASVAQTGSVGAKAGDTAGPAATEPRIAADRHRSKAHSSVVATNGSVTSTGSTVNASEKPAAEIAKSADGVNSVDAPTMPPAASSTGADAPQVAMSTDPAASDSRITTEVKSQIAADSMSKDVDVGVITTNGVVVLSGTLATQDVIDHVKGVAEKVKDVKSVDASALKVTST